MGETVFHKIMKGDIPCDILYQDDLCIAIRDINPASPLHILVIPRKDLQTLNTAGTEDKELLGHLILIAKDLAKKEGLENGYRLVVNCGEDAGQTVFQLHVHLLGGRTFGWPPG